MHVGSVVERVKTVKMPFL